MTSFGVELGIEVLAPSDGEILCIADGMHFSEAGALGNVLVSSGYRIGCVECFVWLSNRMR
jgi:hypothetical protein